MKMIGNRHHLSSIVLAIIVYLGFCNGEVDPEDESVTLSPKCAAVYYSGGAVGGAGLAYALTPTVLCTAGFCPAGVSSSSFASWWQSTMPLVKGGSIFATLQSVAMGGVGTNVVVTGSVLGGTLSKQYLIDLCTYVDDPNSKMALVFDSILVIVRGANQAVDGAKDLCSSSETCSAAADLAQAASDTLISSVSSVWSYVSGGVGQTVESISNKTEMWSLENKVDLLKEKIKDLKESTYTGLIIEKAKDYSWSHGLLNSLSGGTVEEIFTLEKQLEDYEARLSELKQRN